MQCNITEEFPLSVVQGFDAMNDRGLVVPPMFSCQKCGEEMYPEYYKGIHGVEYKLLDVLKVENK